MQSDLLTFWGTLNNCYPNDSIMYNANEGQFYKSTRTGKGIVYKNLLTPDLAVTLKDEDLICFDDYKEQVSGQTWENSGTSREVSGVGREISGNFGASDKKAQGFFADFSETFAANFGSKSEVVRKLFGLKSNDSRADIDSYLLRCVQIYEQVEKSKNRQPRQIAAELLKQAKAEADSNNLAGVVRCYNKLSVKRKQQSRRSRANNVMYAEKKQNTKLRKQIQVAIYLFCGIGFIVGAVLFKVFYTAEKAPALLTEAKQSFIENPAELVAKWQAENDTVLSAWRFEKCLAALSQKTENPMQVIEQIARQKNF